jgi:hypothetical protein
MLSGSAQKMSRDSLREIKKKTMMTSRTRTSETDQTDQSRPTIVVTQIGFRGFGKNYQEEPSCLVLPTCLRKNINQFKVKLKSIYQNLVETTFDTNAIVK